jgi:hypothetical protein
MRPRHAFALGSLAIACGASPAPVEAPAAPPAPVEVTPEVAADATAPADDPAATTPAPAAPAAPAEPPGPRIGSIKYITWVYSQPTHEGRKIGYLREGTSAALASPDAVPGHGCKGGWRSIKPFGFVCHDSSTVLDPKHPLWAAQSFAAQDASGVMPFRYAFSTGAPMYGRIPTEAEQLKVEGDPAKRPKPQKLGSWSSGHEELADAPPIKGTDAVPAIFRDLPPGKTTPVHWGEDHRIVRKWIPNGSMLAFSHAFEANGRTWLLSPDLTIVPADRVRPFRTSTFHGTPLGGDVELPLAWARRDAVTKYERKEGGFSPLPDKLPPRTFVRLGTERIEDGKKAYLATTDPKVWVLESDVAVARAKDKLPFGVKDDEKWLEVHIRTGTLVAYVGLKPVFATLVSPGAGGVGPYNGTNEELVKLSATPLGSYRIVWKTRAAAMSPEKGEPEKFWIADVPWTQYFRAPFAIHTAYWHEDFGMPKSAGCINVSPEDGKHLFGWTDPPVPTSWQGVGPSKEGGLGTVLVVLP